MTPQSRKLLLEVLQRIQNGKSLPEQYKGILRTITQPAALRSMQNTKKLWPSRHGKFLKDYARKYPHQRGVLTEEEKVILDQISQHLQKGRTEE